MTMFSKIKKLLETEDMCVVSKSGTPLYAVMTWEKFQGISDKIKKYEALQKIVEEEVKEGEYDIDINKIPV